MKEYPNFYENISEARRRLADTVVLYDGVPYYVFYISDHNPDGIFRVYMEELNTEGPMVVGNEDVPYHGDQSGPELDKYIENQKNTRIIRKMINSPKFNRFRPFPLGMCNFMNTVSYLTRSPVRPLTQQGLTDGMVRATVVDLNEDKTRLSRSNRPSVFSREFAWTAKGLYPSFDEVAEGLSDPTTITCAGAFDREFALVRGPVKTLFLAYRTDIIGILPNKDRSSVIINNEFKHAKEVTQELDIFDSVLVE